jgi:hypothetical protein
VQSPLSVSAAALLLTLAVGAAGCASAGGTFQYAKDVESRQATRMAAAKGEVTIVWRFGPPEWVSMMCRSGPHDGKVHGCAMRDPGSDRCVMFLVEPRDYQDRDRLAVMGHELWHCQGSGHS